MSNPVFFSPGPCGRLRRALGLLLALSLLLVSGPSPAQRLVYGLGTLTQNVAPGSVFYPPGALTGQQGLAAFDVASGLPVRPVVLVSGLRGAQKLVGLDYRAATGQLYALGYDQALVAGNAQLYALDPISGVAAPVGAAGLTLVLGDATARIGLDIDPVADELRVVSSFLGANYRLSPATGGLLATDGPLRYAAGDANAAVLPRVGGLAYTGAYPGSGAATAYAVDVRDNPAAPPGILSVLLPDVSGTLATRAALTLGGFGIDPAARLDLDIYATPTVEKAYLLELTSPNAAGYSSSNLYELSLASGGATTKRNLVPGLPNYPFNLLGLAVAPLPTISRLAPSDAPAGTNGLALTLTGTGFVNGSVVQFNGVDRATSYGSVTQLTVQLLATDLATAGTYAVRVTNPPFPGESSAPAPFTVTSSSAPDLVVSTPQNVQGRYRNLTVQGPNGIATLVGPLAVSGTLAVQPGGALFQACQPITGSGSFDLQAGATLGICDPAGIAASGASGAVQVTGTRFFSPQARYRYDGTAAQLTGSGLPAQVRELRVENPAGLALSQAVAISEALRLQGGDLRTGGLVLTLLSSTAGTALVENASGAVTGAATVQRAISSANRGLGYRHYAAPVAGARVEGLRTSGFAPVVNPDYNRVGGAATPFPTVFFYDESFVTTSSGGPRTQDFDRGYRSPVALSDGLEVTRGYTVNIAGTETVALTGPLNNGPQATGPLPRGAQTESGYHLRGNPYPAPLDWDKVLAAGRAVNLEDALYVFKSEGQYTGTYSSYVNGASANSGSNVLPLGQGFFVRALAGPAAGSIAFENADRLTTPDATPFQRGTADARARLTLSLRNGPARTQAVVYFQAGASAGFDPAYDARELAAPNGLRLATETPAGTPLAINGLPLLGGADVLLPLQVAVSPMGSGVLRVDDLSNLPVGYHAYLRDALAGTYTELALTPGIAFSVSGGGAASGRYAVLFTPQARVLASTAPAALAALASLYPNPAHGIVTLLLPAALRGRGPLTVAVVDNLGRTVRTLRAGTAEALEVSLAGLAPGVYAVRAHTAVGLVVKRLMVE